MGPAAVPYRRPVPDGQVNGYVRDRPGTGGAMYIGIGTLVVILLVLLSIYFLRRA